MAIKPDDTAGNRCRFEFPWHGSIRQCSVNAIRNGFCPVHYGQVSRPSSRNTQCDACTEQGAFVRVTVTALQGKVLGETYVCADCVKDPDLIPSLIPGTLYK